MKEKLGNLFAEYNIILILVVILLLGIFKVP